MFIPTLMESMYSDSANSPAARGPTAWLRNAYRQVAASWRSSFLGSGPSIIPSGIPELPGQPLLGSLGQFRNDLIGLLQDTSALGPVSRFRMFRIPMHVVTDTAIAHEILNEKRGSFIKSRELSTYLQPLLGTGLLAADGEVHHRHRKLLAPAFAAKRVSDYGDLMVEETIRQVALWSPSRRVDMVDEMTMLTLSIVGRALFGRAMRQETEEIASAFTAAMRTMMKRITAVIQAPYSFPLPINQRMKQAVATLDAVVERIIAQRRAEGGDHGDVLSMLLLSRDEADGSGLTDKEVRDEVITLLAGHEATASALTWIWYELGRNPLAYAKLTAEVDRVLGDRAVTVADLPNLPYTLASIEEAMRLHPPVYALAREAAEDVELGGHRFGARSTIFINLYGVYRQDKYYPDPDAFKPEHMTPEAKRARPRYAYLPFGDGPRVCIGAHFAILELQLALATMVQRGRADIEPGERKTDPLMTLRLRGGLPATVGPRRR
jgi:cytochrome P450